MAMGMDISWHKSTDSATVPPPRLAEACDGAPSTSERHSLTRSTVEQWCSLITRERDDALAEVRCLRSLNARRLELYRMSVDDRQRLDTEARGLREMLDRDTAKSEESRAENERLTRERDEARAEAARYRARLEARLVETIETDDDAGESQCLDCGRSAATPEAIRHVAGTRIGERPCPYLLDVRAMGMDVLDDSGEVAP